MLAFIDESGDQGTLGKGSRWLVFGAVMVSDADASDVRAVVNSVVPRLAGGGQRKAIHFTDMSHDDRRGCLTVLASAPWLGSVIASDTTSVRDGSLLYIPRLQYNYTAKYAIERISARGAETGEPATIFFEDRANFDLDEFREYIARCLAQRDARLDPKIIDPSRIHQMPKGADAILCMSDALAFSAFRALEPHRVWGHQETSYLETVKSKLWRGPAARENVHKWGFLLRPTDLLESVFRREYPWINAL